MRKTKLFCALPDYISTPDSMAIDRHGNLVLSCPNFAEDSSSGCVVKISKEGKVTKWFDVPVHPETGKARNMGITFDDDWNVYLCDNQGWSERPELINKGRILKLVVDDSGVISKTTVVAKNMEHPNGIRIKDGCMYVTNSYMHPVKRSDGKLTSGVYRFTLTEENVNIKNDLSDKNLFASFVTQNPACQYGVDGIVFDSKGDLYIGNFGDGEVYRLTFNPDGTLKSNVSFAKDPKQLQTTDGMIFDAEGNLYIADFSANAIGKVNLDGKVERIAQSPDCTGLEGGLDQPGEPIIWNGRIIASCFDLVTGPDKINTAHEMPATLAEIPLWE
jgi:sugar lactone lactonase YvrE